MEGGQRGRGWKPAIPDRNLMADVGYLKKKKKKESEEGKMGETELAGEEVERKRLDLLRRTLSLPPASGKDGEPERARL